MRRRRAGERRSVRVRHARGRARSSPTARCSSTPPRSETASTPCTRRVEDAAGNADVVFDGTVQTHNAPINAAAPALAGPGERRRPAHRRHGQWDGAPTGYDHRWLRCDADGAACDARRRRDRRRLRAHRRGRLPPHARRGHGRERQRRVDRAQRAERGRRRRRRPHDAAVRPGRIGQRRRGIRRRHGHAATGRDPGDRQPARRSSPATSRNGDDATARARLEVAFQRADGGTAHARRAARTAAASTIVGRLTDAAGDGHRRRAPRRRVADRRPRLGRAPGRAHRRRTAASSTSCRPGRAATCASRTSPFSDSRAVELSNVVHADVLAPLTIRADRRRVSGDRVVRLSGRVGGGPIPRAGLLVTLQGFQPGWGWRDVPHRADRSPRPLEHALPLPLQRGPLRLPRARAAPGPLPVRDEPLGRRLRRRLVDRARRAPRSARRPGWARRRAAAGSASIVSCSMRAICAMRSGGAPAACAATTRSSSTRHRPPHGVEAGGVVAQLRALAAGVVDHALGGAVELERRVEQRLLGGRPGSSLARRLRRRRRRIRRPSRSCLLRMRDAGEPHPGTPAFIILAGNRLRRKRRTPENGASPARQTPRSAAQRLAPRAARRARSAASRARRGRTTSRSSVRAVGFPAPASSSQMRRWGTPVRSETASCVS